MLFVNEGFTFRNFLVDAFAVFMFVVWFWLLITVFSDLFRRHDTSGWVKAAWVAFLIILPFLGVLVYLIANGHGMAQRSAERAQAAQSQFNDYVASVAKDGGGAATELEKAKGLLDSGALTQPEYDALKAKLIA